MVGVRTTVGELEAQASEALQAAFAAAGLHAQPGPTGEPTDLVLDGPAGPIAIEIKAANTLDPGRLHAVTAGTAKGSDRHIVVVADRLIGPVADMLDELGWGYL